MRSSTLVRNVTVAVVLLLLVATVVEADFSITHGVRDYIAFVLTTDYDYRPWLETVRERVLSADLSWPEFLRLDTVNSPADDSGR